MQNIANSTDEEILLSNSVDFAKDSLFCEYAYVLNLDTDELEIFEGFNKEPLTNKDRFYNTEKNDYNGLHPVKLIRKIKFKDITKTYMSELEELLDKEED